MSRNDSTTRIKILNAATQLLREKGGRGVRMGDIAKAAGISRQAVYLHFVSRTELLVATVRHLDQLLGLDRRLEPSRTAKTGLARLDAYIECWGNYLPEIHAVTKALRAEMHTDEAAAEAWRDRMLAMRDGCRAAVEALAADGVLVSDWPQARVIDLLWAMLSVANWEVLTQDCGWTAAQYIEATQRQARRTLTTLAY